VISVQLGAGIADKMFGTVPPASVTTLRLWFAALFLLLAGGRGAVRAVVDIAGRRAWRDGAAAAGFGVALGVMNYSIYQAFARIPLGVAVTIEFLGPLAVSVAGSRHRRDLLWVVLGALGVVLLTGGVGRQLDLAGVLFALLAGLCWALYILLSRANGQRFSGPSGLVLAMVVAAVVVTPPGLATSHASAMFGAGPLAEGAAIGLMSSVVPYWLELEVLRRIPARVFGVWMSMEPAVAALIGLILLGQSLTVLEWLAIGCVMVACAGASRGLGHAALARACRFVRPGPYLRMPVRAPRTVPSHAGSCAPDRTRSRSGAHEPGWVITVVAPQPCGTAAAAAGPLDVVNATPRRLRVSRALRWGRARRPAPRLVADDVLVPAARRGGHHRQYGDHVDRRGGAAELVRAGLPGLAAV
jgi:inner membrane transporter RhtA